MLSLTKLFKFTMLLKRFSLLFLSIIFSVHVFGQQPKYIFYLIGDGMGLNQVNLAEIHQAELKGVNGTEPLVFTKFPYVGFASTNSLSHGVTDSGAGGTALAVGRKTKNGVIGMDSTGTIPYKSIAYAAKEKGMKVGITTSVSIDHATPASFYANQADRDMYYEIGKDIIKSNFDFFAGSGFLKPNTSFDKKEMPALVPQLEKAGYKIVKGKAGFDKEKNKGQRMILMNIDGTAADALKFSIDQEAGDFKLADITQAAITSLNTNNNKGFFLMVEGGKIDWSAHANDAATTIHEVLDFNESVKLAYEFYRKYPKETLIVVTADHETGGLGIGNGSSTLNTKVLAHQKVSQGALSAKIGELRKNNPNAGWDEVKKLLGDNLGLWSVLKVSEKAEAPIYEAYKKSFIDHHNETEKSLYASDDKIATLSIELLNKLGSIAWSSKNHSAAYVPVYAIGQGAETFHQKLDNTDIPKKIAEVAGFDF
ncbi:alkaline phosphatase [Sphingobacterium yanglingense]|uniref:Alkaline phosphatase n=1 Tax=Sphingobacterium yanglingense TaxID=1437280 RepID=A0A4R6WHD8_9SPHI|nr:alkaline phosphatase [Sphingobacterium yanglingense]